MLVIQFCLLFIIVSISTPCLTCRNEWLTVVISKRMLAYAALQAAINWTDLAQALVPLHQVEDNDALSWRRSSEWKVIMSDHLFVTDISCGSSL